MRLNELISGLPDLTVTGNTDMEIAGLTKDSRQVKDGYIFFATEKSKDYVEEAIERGARIIVTDSDLHMPVDCMVKTVNPRLLLGKMASAFYGHPSQNLSVTGITGTNGKTTITYLIESILRHAGRRPGVIGTISHRFNGYSIQAKNTTPDAVELQQLLAGMLRQQVDTVVMEVSSHALDQERVEGIDFDGAIFTNLTHDHLDYHKTIERYKDAKRLLFQRYLMNSSKGKRWAILNMDDPVAHEFIPDMPVQTLFYSLEQRGDAYPLSVSETIEGLTLTLMLGTARMTIRSRLIGRFNIANILASCLFGFTSGFPVEGIKAGIESLEMVPGRLERVNNPKGAFIFIDYAHTPDALERVLTLLSGLKRGRLIVIFGCGGDRDKAKRPVMGQIASRLSDIAIITADNPRTEDPRSIIDGILAGIHTGSYRVIENRREAIAEGVRIARDNDIVLVAGKGHEDYQIIGTQVYPFSDREVIEESL